MIVVATADFELYHEVVTLLRDRGVTFTTVEPDDEFPDETSVVITSPTDGLADRLDEEGIDYVTADADEVRHAVNRALAAVRGDAGRTVIGVDPGTRPGIAVLNGEMVVAAFHVPIADAVDVIRREVEDADTADSLVRVGDGARLQGARIVNELDDVPVELVDETGTTPYLGTGARGMGDVLAAVNIARIGGDGIDQREIEPTAGELQRIKNRSREASEGDRTIDEALARRVAAGELTIDEALAKHREQSEE